MTANTLKEDIHELLKQADRGIGLREFIDGICQLFSQHESELAGITYSYRLCASDTGYVKAFSLDDGHFFEMSEMGEADVIVTGTEQALLSVLKRDVSPMSALLRGKIKINGSKAALIRFA
ncbi:MAG: SCP2 sterol-binding domain-containing protein, partial [Clostridia bacterium]